MLSALDLTGSRARWRAGTHRGNLMKHVASSVPVGASHRIPVRAGFVMPVIGGFGAAVNFLAPMAAHPGGGAGEVF